MSALVESCDCRRCEAARRLLAFADVFEQAGDYSAAACAREWAARTTQDDEMGFNLAMAIMTGEASG